MEERHPELKKRPRQPRRRRSRLAEQDKPPAAVSRPSGAWIGLLGVVVGSVVDDWFDKFGLYRPGARREVLEFRLEAQRVALVLELGFRALRVHMS
jgi:hypothetical protein